MGWEGLFNVLQMMEAPLVWTLCILVKNLELISNLFLDISPPPPHTHTHTNAIHSTKISLDLPLILTLILGSGTHQG